jgi:hypothetical protein
MMRRREAPSRTIEAAPSFETHRFAMLLGMRRREVVADNGRILQRGEAFALSLSPSWERVASAER